TCRRRRLRCYQHRSIRESQRRRAARQGASHLCPYTLGMADSPAPPLSWGHSTVATACPLDCPDSCSLSVTVERGRVVKIDGSHVAPSTGGYICGKVRQFDRRVYGADRVLHPLMRTGPKSRNVFERVTWDEALDLIVRRMQE